MGLGAPLHWPDPDGSGDPPPGCMLGILLLLAVLIALLARSVVG